MSIRSSIASVLRLAEDPKQTKWTAPALLFFDALLCAAIIYKVPYTEIDWSSYMQQVATYFSGQRDYGKIRGDTGPLVYPGLHVYIYGALYKLTGEGKNIMAAQAMFMVLYIAALGVVMACYRQAKAPPYLFPLLVLSKRLHSIFLLRMFNDCFTVLFLFLAIFFYQRRNWTVGTAFFSCGLGVKMNMLLALPAVSLAMLQALGLDRSVTQALLLTQTQGLFAWEFVRVDYKAYLTRAFQLNRQFLHKWTVNWRFVPEHTFLSPLFSSALLVGHASTLLFFAATRWARPSQRPLVAAVKLQLRDADEWELKDAIERRVDAEYVLTSVLTANSIGMLFARSLHYQFYAWTAWATPFLLWRAGFHPVLIYAIWAAQEWAWNVFPSTEVSSAVVVACLAITVVGVWVGTGKESKRDVDMESKVKKSE